MTAMISLLVLVACGGGGRSPPNLLLVSLDTVRWDRTSLAGSRDTTPNLAALAAAGTTWPNAWSVGNESIYSHAALLTGRYPSEVALPDYGSFSVPADLPTLATVLSAYGYSTGAFTGGGHVIADYGFDSGFQVFQTATGDSRAGSLFDAVPAALAWIRGEEDTPWFAFVHGYDAHSPYVQRGPSATSGAAPPTPGGWTRSPPTRSPWSRSGVASGSPIGAPWTSCTPPGRSSWDWTSTPCPPGPAPESASSRSPRAR